MTVKSFEEIDLKAAKTREEVFEILMKELKIPLETMQNSISEYIKSNSDNLARHFVNIAPYQNFDQLLEDHEEMNKFVADEASKPENWVIVRARPKTNSLMEFTFDCRAVDDPFRAYVIVGLSGKIRHTFAQVE